MVPASVETLVRERCNFSDFGESRRPRQDALADVRVHADLLPLGIGQRTWLVPYGSAHGNAAEIVHQRGTADLALVAVAEAHPASGSPGEVGHAARVRAREARFQ